MGELSLIHIYCAADTELYDAFDITYDYDIWPYFEGCFQPTGTLREYTALVNFQESEYPAGYVLSLIHI